MSTDDHLDGTNEQVVRYRDVVQSDGHAWVLARDDADWFYECLKCADRVHVLSIADMNRAVEHHYAYMPLRHRAPWNHAMTIKVMHTNGEITEEERPPYPPCAHPDAPLPDVMLLKRGPLVAVPKEG
jgi:hypothetical protein